jgi:hypothetical protein
MSGVVQSIRNQPAINPRLLPAIDQLLIAGIKLGLRKKHDAINKILQLVPEWSGETAGDVSGSCEGLPRWQLLM